MRLSQFCHFVGVGESFTAAYNALTLGVVLMDSATAGQLVKSRAGTLSRAAREMLSADNGQLVGALQKHKILLEDDSMADEDDYQLIQSVLDHRRIGILYLIITDACNLACRYCFVENAMPPGYAFSKMTQEIARRGIDSFANAVVRSHGIDEPQIILYGGEPLLNLPLIRFALEYIGALKARNKLPVQTSITINTNGTRITDEVAKILHGVENLNVAISIDGPASIHDECRPYLRGGGTFDDAMRGYRLLRDAGIEAGLCCTISRRNVHELEQIARWFVDKLNVTSMGFNILIESAAADEVRGTRQDYAEAVADQLIRCFLFFRERGIYEDRIMRKVNAFADGKIYYYDCGGCGQQMVVSPDGMVGVCQAYCGTKKNFVPLDEAFDPLTHPVWDEWRRRSPLAMPQCRRCIALSICGGGCPYSAGLRHGSIWALDDVFCVHARKTVEFLLKDLARNMIG